MSPVEALIAAALVFAAASVIARDPVYSALFLSASALFVAAAYGSAGYAALVLLILVVYVGAVSMFIIFSAAMLGERLGGRRPLLGVLALASFPLILTQLTATKPTTQAVAQLSMSDMLILVVSGVAALVVAAILISSKWRQS